MPISLRIPESKEHLLKQYTARVGKTKTAVILEAVDENLGLKVDHNNLIRNLSGWLNEKDAFRCYCRTQLWVHKMAPAESKREETPGNHRILDIRIINADKDVA